MWQKAEKFLKKDKYIGLLIEKYGHCTLKTRSKAYYFEDLIDAIVQQQLSMKAASSIFNRIKDAIVKKQKKQSGNTPGSRKHKWREDKTKKIRITPNNLRLLNEKDFRKCGLSRAKVIYVYDLLDKVESKKLKISKLEKLTDEEIESELISVKGIGEWTVHMFLMFSLGRVDIFPTGDLGLRNAFKKVVKKDLDKKQLDRFATRWKPYRTIASWYIWKTLEGN